ncbi:MAG: PEP-CTERM sorting domain-containing protein [Rubrivivax sp.]|nr:PEP-CTERM sorting domain-containing protein [Rubrivivax sp.]
MLNKIAMTGALLAAGWAQAATTYVSVANTGPLTTGASNFLTPFAGGPAVDQLTVDFTLTFNNPTFPANDFGDLFTLWMDNGTSPIPFTQGVNLGLRYNMGPAGADYYISTGGLSGPFASVPFTTSANLFAYFFKSTGPGGAGNFDRAAFWVNPTMAEKTNYTNPDLIVNTQPGSFSSLTRMGMRVSGLEAGENMVVTNLTITDAVPEPSAIALALAGLGVLGVMARRRRTV